MRLRTVYRSPSGIKKAALFMFSLDEDHAVQ